MVQPYFRRPLLIPGSTSPGNDVDLYLCQLIDMNYGSKELTSTMLTLFLHFYACSIIIDYH